MNILMIGDVVAEYGCNFLMNKLPNFKKTNKIDLCIVNGENSANGNGITPTSAEMLFDAGADVITSGNHVYKWNTVYDYLDCKPYIIRPANYNDSNPGRGYCIVDKGSYSVAVVNLSGTAFMENLYNPFFCIDEILDELKKEKVSVIAVDFHAEATGEKRAMGFYLDGRVSVLAGTHTHVQSNDACVFENGTGYITDLGMTGNMQSVLGVEPKIIINKLKYQMPSRFATPAGKCSMEGCVFDVDEKTGKCRSAKNIRVI